MRSATPYHGGMEGLAGRGCGDAAPAHLCLRPSGECCAATTHAQACLGKRSPLCCCSPNAVTTPDPATAMRRHGSARSPFDVTHIGINILREQRCQSSEHVVQRRLRTGRRLQGCTRPRRRRYHRKAWQRVRLPFSPWISALLGSNRSHAVCCSVPFLCAN